MFRSCQSRVMAGGLFLAAWLLSPQRIAAWGPGGHRVVANIAYDRIDPATRSEIIKVLRNHPQFDKWFASKMPDDIRSGNPEDQERWTFLQASIWPDLVRPFPPYHKETWHFVNLPYFLSPLDQSALQGSINPNVTLTLPNPLAPAVRDQLNCVQAFKLCLQELTDAHTTDEERAISFCWLLHLAGDIHQPLHSTGLVTRGRFNTSEGDRGGNKIMIKQGRNLHSFWDGLLGGNQTLNDIRGRAADIVGSADLKKAGEKAAGQLAPEAWMQESNELAKSFVYDKLILDEVTAREADVTQPLHKIDLPVTYRQQAGRMAQQRVAEAGYRLAEILKSMAE